MALELSFGILLDDEPISDSFIWQNGGRVAIEVELVHGLELVPGLSERLENDIGDLFLDLISDLLDLVVDVVFVAVGESDEVVLLVWLHNLN